MSAETEIKVAEKKPWEPKIIAFLLQLVYLHSGRSGRGFKIKTCHERKGYKNNVFGQG